MTWRDDAACKSMDTRLFFADDTTDAKATCAACPVRTACAFDAAQHDYAGIWGGLTAEQRRSLKVGSVTVWCDDCGDSFVTEPGRRTEICRRCAGKRRRAARRRVTRPWVRPTAVRDLGFEVPLAEWRERWEAVS